MHFKLLKNTYDKQIRCSCNNFQKKIDECLEDNFYNQENCNTEIKKFLDCINNFNLDWNKKHQNYRYKIFE